MNIQPVPEYAQMRGLMALGSPVPERKHSPAYEKSHVCGACGGSYFGNTAQRGTLHKGCTASPRGRYRS